MQLVLIRARVHPFPFRTRKLSSLLPKILVWRRTGKIGSANTRLREVGAIYSSIAQSVEHATVNRRVVGSSPTWGAKIRLAASYDGEPYLMKIFVDGHGPLAQLVRATGS